jgi:hypothetical protein
VLFGEAADARGLLSFFLGGSSADALTRFREGVTDGPVWLGRGILGVEVDDVGILLTTGPVDEVDRGLVLACPLRAGGGGDLADRRVLTLEKRLVVRAPQRRMSESSWTNCG